MEDESERKPKLTCKVCRSGNSFTAPISVILVFAPRLERPYPLIPAHDYQICSQCDAVFTMVDKAVESHSITREAGPWTRAILLFIDGQGLDVAPRRDSPRINTKIAMA